MAQPLPKHRAREYETTFIVSPESTAEKVEQIAGRISSVIQRLDGKLLRAENWGRRRLAYPVRKNDKGLYIYMRYLGYSDLVHELERNLRMLEPVIMYLSVKIEEDVNPDARPVDPNDISFMPAVVDSDELAAEEKAETKTEEKAETKTEEKAEAKTEEKAEAKTEEKAEENETPAEEKADEAAEKAE